MSDVMPLVLTCFNGLFTLLWGCLALMFRRSMRVSDERLNRVEDRIALVADQRVTKEEWLRDIGTSRKQRDVILRALSELKGENRATVEIASAVAASLNRTEKH